MDRTSSMRGLRRIAAVAHFAKDRGISTTEAFERLRARAAAHVAERKAEAAGWLGQGVPRRAFLKGVGAATLIGGAFAGSGPAWAKKPSASTARIAVVGGGMGGLACAHSLLGKGVFADVYEASERVGGRILSIGGAFPGAVDFPGQVGELGGEFIDTLHGTMRGYANTFNLATEDVLKEADGEALFYISGQLYDEADVVDEYGDFVDAMQDDLRLLSNTITPASFSPDDAILDFTNLDEYLVTRGASPLIRDLVRESYRNEYGREVSEQSCLNFLFMIHADHRSHWEPWGVFSDERFHVLGGNQQIPEAIAATLGTRMKYGHRLTAVSKLSSGAYSLTFDQEHGPNVVVEYDYVVFAIPFTVLRTISLDTNLGLPPEKQLVIDTLQYGTNSKMLLGFDGQPWRDAGSSGTVYTFGLSNMNSGWEANPELGTASSAIFVDYSGGIRGEGLSEADPEGEAEAWLLDFEQVLPGASAFVRRDTHGDPVAAVKNWSEDPNTLGAYTCNQPGYFTTLADLEGTRVGNLLFAGEHANSFYAFQGWMEGAALSGIDAADTILADLRIPV